MVHQRSRRGRRIPHRGGEGGGGRRHRVDHGDQRGHAKDRQPVTVTPSELEVRGLYVQFERRGWPSGYWSGDLIKNFADFDEVVGHTVTEEVSQQLDVMRTIGVNTITFELRSYGRGA